jgi:hypothetical protein
MFKNEKKKFYKLDARPLPVQESSNPGPEVTADPDHVTSSTGKNRSIAERIKSLFGSNSRN